MRMRRDHDLPVLNRERIPMLGRDRKATLRIKTERGGSLEH